MLRSLSVCVGRRGLATTSPNGLPFSAGGNDYRYEDVVRNFKWDVPDKFNFARDVVDRLASESASSTALFHVGHQETKWSFQDVSSRSKKCAAALAALGSVKRAVLVLSRVPDWWTINIAAMRTGCVLMPGTTLLTTKDIAERIIRSGADCIIGDVETAKKVEADVSGACGKIKHKILVTSDEDAAESVSSLRARGWILFKEMLAAHSEQDCPEPNNSAADDMQVFFTSGTTGLPKMVPHTHASYGFCHWVTGKLWLDLTPTDLHWNVADSGWAKSAWSSLLGPWSQGAGVFVHAMKQFTASDVLKVLSSYPITTLCAPPTLYRAFMQEKLTSFSFPSLRHCVSAGEPLNQEVVHAWEEATGLLIKEGYGQTETTLLCGSFKGMEVRPGSMGKVAPGYDVRIVNNMGVEMPRGEQGNIGICCVPDRPAGLFPGYLDSPDETVKCMAGDFYLTGDRATMDKDGYVWFDARMDDIIISAGYRIGPFEVESVLLEHPAVAESAVVASPDVKRGQVVKAFIVLSAGYKSQASDPDSRGKIVQELQDFVKKKTAPYKYPRKIEFVESLPKTVSGKIRRAELRKEEKHLARQ